MFHSSRILIVDDEESFIRLEERILRNLFITQSARSGEEALKLVPIFHPDLILLDIRMPTMDGYEFCRHLRQKEAWKLIKVFMVSGRNSLKERLAGYEAGADEYITKPFDHEEFLAKIRVFLRLRHTEEIERMKSILLEMLAEAVEVPRNIINLTGELIDSPDHPDHLWEHLSLVFRSAVELSHFVDKAARLQSLRQGVLLNPHPDLLKEHLTEVIRLWEPAIKYRGLRSVLDCPADLVVKADWRAMEEVFGYLLDNAIRYSDQGQAVIITAYPWGDDCFIHFLNQGPGIDPTRVDTIFTPFSVDDIIHHHKGHGLSLSIARQLVELHRGEISFKSNPGNDTIFTITLPQGETN